MDAIAENIDHVYERHERFLFVDAYLAGIPRNPLPPAGTSNRDASRAVMRSYSNLADHVAAVEGQLAGDQVYNGPVGPVAEAVISEETADQFGLGVGDEVVMTRELGGRRMVTVLITGIVRPIDPSDDYWKPLFSTRVFLDPPSVEEEVEGPGRPVQPGRASSTPHGDQGGPHRLAGRSVPGGARQLDVVHHDRHGAPQGLVRGGG